VNDKRNKWRVNPISLRYNNSSIIEAFARKEIAKRENDMTRKYDVDQFDNVHKGHSENNQYIVYTKLPSFPNSGFNRITTETVEQARAFEIRLPIFKISVWPHACGKDHSSWGLHSS